MESSPSSPRVFLAIDNCFASRRWTAPADWADAIRDLGISYVEASADNECDPLYTSPEYLAGWIAEVRAVYERTGVRVANLYSGHGTYTTTGLGHHDVRVRDRILNDWLKVMAKMAGQLGAGLGFACHAFSEPILQDPAKYESAEQDLYDRLAELAVYAQENGTGSIGTEQMYYPRVIPWTIAGAGKMLREVYRRGHRPFYLTIDTGHMYGQRRFLRPGLERLNEIVKQFRETGDTTGVWLGPTSAYDRLHQLKQAPGSEVAPGIACIEEEMGRYPHLFASDEDGDPYFWLQQLGCYSPIIHLQQTAGTSSAHLPFTAKWNATGIVRPDKVLHAIARSFAAPQEADMPPRCDALYLTLEIFPGTADLPTDILTNLEESVAYWRQWVPRDGLTLDELLRTA